MTSAQDLGHRSRRARTRGGIPTAVTAIAGVLLLLFLAWFLFLRNDEPSTSPAASRGSGAPGGAAEEEVAAAPPRKAPVETFEVFAPKDPFDPLVAGSSGGGGGGARAAGTSTTTAPDGTVTTITTTGRSDGGTNAAHRVRVVDVVGETDALRVQIDGAVYTVAKGERFATSFQLISASGRCASMLYGDDQFSLCEGEEILK